MRRPDKIAYALSGYLRGDTLPHMSLVSAALRTAVRNSRRLRGRVQLTGKSVTGSTAPAVIEAIKKAAVGRPTPPERQWIERIETLRQLLLQSPKRLELVDLGAGAGARFDTGAEAPHVISISLGEMTRSSKVPRWAYLLFRLVRELRPETVLEMGSCVGISAAYQAAALELNGTGRLITLEGADVLAARSTRTLEELDLGHRAAVRLGDFRDTLDSALAELKPVTMAFIDGNHREAATVEYADRIFEAAGPEAVFVFDDINWSDGMRRAWRAIVADPRYALTVDLRSVGIAVVSAPATGRKDLKASYY